MSLSQKILFGWLVLLMANVSAVAAQEGDSTVAWYRHFFQDQKQSTAEKSIQQRTVKLQQAINRNDRVLEAQALKEIALIHLTRTYDYARSMDFLIKALGIEDTLGLKDKQVFTYLAIAKVFEEVGDYYKSDQFLNMALKIAESLDNAPVRALILNEAGKINALLGNDEKALEYYNHVLEYDDEIERATEAEALFNLGHLFTLQRAYEKALSSHKLALSIRRSIGDDENEALSLNDIGELYRLMKNNDKALANHVVALEIRQKRNDKRGVAESFNNIGALYYQQKNFRRAMDNLQLALKAGRESQDHHQMARSSGYLSECYEAMGDFKKALEYKGEYFAMNDLISNEQSEQQLLETQDRYMIGKREAQIEKLETDRILREKELDEQKRFRNFLFVLVVLCLLIAGLVIYFLIQQKQSNKKLEIANSRVNVQNLELQELNATKDKFFSIISHDLKGPLNSLTSFSSLLINHTESLSKEEIKMFAVDFDKSLKNLFSLLENLLEWSRSQTGNIEFTPESFDLALVLEENKALLKAQAQNKKITLRYENGGPQLIRAHKNSINTVVRNLISNAIKFTLEEGIITLELTKMGTDVVVSVTDTGVGMPPEVVNRLFRIDSKHSTKGTANEKGTGLGLILCKEFVEKNGGQIWVKSKEGQGSAFYFSLPSSDQG
jgi:signal transduction histidine kinase